MGVVILHPKVQQSKERFIEQGGLRQISGAKINFRNSSLLFIRTGNQEREKGFLPRASTERRCQLWPWPEALHADFNSLEVPLQLFDCAQIRIENLYYIAHARIHGLRVFSHISQVLDIFPPDINFQSNLQIYF